MKVTIPSHLLLIQELKRLAKNRRETFERQMQSGRVREKHLIRDMPDIALGNITRFAIMRRIMMDLQNFSSSSAIETLNQEIQRAKKESKLNENDDGFIKDALLCMALINDRKAEDSLVTHLSTLDIYPDNFFMVVKMLGYTGGSVALRILNSVLDYFATSEEQDKKKSLEIAITHIKVHG